MNESAKATVTLHIDDKRTNRLMTEKVHLHCTKAKVMSLSDGHQGNSVWC